MNALTILTIRQHIRVSINRGLASQCCVTRTVCINLTEISCAYFCLKYRYQWYKSVPASSNGKTIENLNPSSNL
jgi:hypothetical protein